jgi:hypothetical protein
MDISFFFPVLSPFSFQHFTSRFVAFSDRLWIMDLISLSQPSAKVEASKPDSEPPGKAADRPRSLFSMATIQDDDERLLERIGYKQVD